MPGHASTGSFSWYFWVPIVGPLIGGVIGVLLYDWFIGDVLHARGNVPEPPGRTREPVEDEEDLENGPPAVRDAAADDSRARRSSVHRGDVADGDTPLEE